MKKCLAILCTVAWSAFWVFGYLALTAEADSQQIAALTGAAAGFFVGVFSYLRLVRLTGPGHWRPAYLAARSGAADQWGGL